MADDKGVSSGWAFLAGVLIGAAAGLLLAPQTGRKSREQLRRYARQAEENLDDLAEVAGDAFDKAMDKGREFIEDRKSVLSEALEAGREAMQRERDRLSKGKKS
jgi:gas vesicle protein